MGAVQISNPELSQQVHTLMAANLVWDNHGCMPLRPDDATFLPQLKRYHDAGVDGGNGALEEPRYFLAFKPLAVWRHRRSISDEAIKACAATGGVVGINGIGLFLGANDSRTETIVRHIDYVVQLVGPEYVGIGLDYMFDQQEVVDFLAANPKTFPPGEYGNGVPALVTPEQIPQIAQQLLGLGYGQDALHAILGGNHLRVARKVWQ